MEKCRNLAIGRMLRGDQCRLQPGRVKVNQDKEMMSIFGVAGSSRNAAFGGRNVGDITRFVLGEAVGWLAKTAGADAAGLSAIFLDRLAGPGTLSIADRLHLGGIGRLAIARLLARSGRVIEAWSLCDEVRTASGRTVGTTLAEAKVFMAAGELAAALACIRSDDRPTNRTVQRVERMISKKLYRKPSAGLEDMAIPIASLGGDSTVSVRPSAWHDLSPGRAIRSLPSLRNSRARLNLMLRALGQRRRFSSILWWSRRTVAKSILQEGECLIALGRFDEAEELVSTIHAGKRSTLHLRVLSEVYIRRGDFDAFHRLLLDAVRLPPERVNGISPFGWMAEFYGNHPDPAALLPKGSVDSLMTLVSRFESIRVQKRLAILFRSRFGRRLVETSVCDDPAQLTRIPRFHVLETWALSGNSGHMSSLASYAATEARSTSLDTKSWQHVSLLVDSLLASGDVETAEELALVHIENRLTGRHAPVPLAEMRALASRFPMSVAITQRFVDFAERNRQALVAQYGRDWIEKLRAGDWSRLIGSARGKRCFIVGSGPSLNLLPLDRMRGTDIICVNRGHEAISRGLPPPRFLVVSDHHVYGTHKTSIDTAPVERLFLHGGCVWSRPASLPASVVPFGTSSHRFSHGPRSFAPWVFHRGETVVVIAAQVAAVLGYDEIVLIGVDLNFGEATTHFYGGGIRDRERLDSFRAGGIGPSIANAAFRNLAVTLAAQGKRMVNASPGGGLESISRANFEELF